jgi:hypothetical protein
MQSESDQRPELQSPHNLTINTTSVDRSLLCLAVGQVVINLPGGLPPRAPLHRMHWSDWVYAVFVAGWGLWSAYWLVQFGLAHFSNPRWGEPVGLFGLQLLLSLALLEWGVLVPLRVGKRYNK